MKKVQGLFVLLLISSAVVITGCSKKEIVVEEYSGDGVHYSSSDKDFSNFLNDFTMRNSRYGDDSLGGSELGNGTGFAKNWETMGLVWNNCRGDILGDDKMDKFKSYFLSITQDDNGMIYNTYNSLMAGSTSAGGSTDVSQGWPFPTAANSLGNSCTFEFNSSQEKDYWTSAGASSFTIGDDGYARFASEPTTDCSFKMYTDKVSSFATTNGGIVTKNAPIVELDLSYDDANGYIDYPLDSTNVEDIYLIWQTKEGGDNWYEASRSLYSTSPLKLESSFSDRLWFEMYKNSSWEGKTVTSLGIEIKPKDGKALNLKNGRVNYIRPDYDTRQSNSTYQFILAVNNYINFSNDNSLLATLMPKLRRSLLFLTHTLNGSDGLLDISYLYGHNGIGWTLKDGISKNNLGDGIGNGYWDVLPSPALSLEANVYYYEALVAMSNLEKRVVDTKAKVTSTDIRNREIGGNRVAYSFDSSSLLTLASKVKANIEKDIDPILKDGSYTNDGGFYNPATKRFASGVRADDGKILDYGYTYWNLEAITAGIGTDEEKSAILDWIEGKRIVEGDTSKGEDLYFYEFAPRFSSVANYIDYGFTYTSPGFSKQVQDGGAVICWSYYDMMSRLSVKGADDAFSRMKSIEKWYEKVAKAGGSGADFYNDYYVDLEDGTGVYSLQQSGYQNGAMGLDSEFLESIVMPSVVPYGFFGLDASSANTLGVKNSLPSSLDYLQIDNLMYGDIKYSALLEDNEIVIKNVKGTIPDDYSLNLTIKAVSGDNSRVFVNGSLVKDGYSIKDGYVSVSVPFGNVTVNVL